MNRGMLFRVAVIGLLFGAVASCAPKPVTQLPSGPSATLFDMPAKAFFALESVGRPIDAPTVDHHLLAAALFHETNSRRRENGLPLLGHDSRLDAAARMHATDMARDNYLSHTNAQRSERREPWDRAILAGFKPRFLAENIATHFTLQYKSGVIVYRVPTGTGYSYRPDGPPLPRHTYRSFASGLLDQWMNSPGHRHNILFDEPERFGSDCRLRQEKGGMDKFYCVQVFGTENTKS